MGREEFLEKVWEWRDEYGRKIETKLKKWEYSVIWEEKDLQWMKM